MTWTTAQLAAMASTWLWPFFRIGAMLAVAPVFGARYVPVRIRLGLAVVLTLVVAPVLPPMPPVAAFSAEMADVGKAG